MSPANPPLNLPPKHQGETLTAKSAVENELAQWERFALNRLGEGETRPFEVTAVPDELAFEVSAGLLFAQDRESVKSVFAGVRAGLGVDFHHRGTEGIWLGLKAIAARFWLCSRLTQWRCTDLLQKLQPM